MSCTFKLLFLNKYIVSSKMSHAHLSKNNKNQELRIYKMDTNHDNNALSDIASKYVIGRKGTESPKLIRKYLYSRKSKYNNDSLEDDHSRKSSMGSVGDGMGGEKDVINIMNKGGPTTYSSNHFRVANGRRFSLLAQNSPQNTIPEILPGNPWTFSSHKRSQFVSPNKSVSVDECHLNGHRCEGNSSSESSKRTSQNSLLQLPASNGYKVSMSKSVKSYKKYNYINHVPKINSTLQLIFLHL